MTSLVILLLTWIMLSVRKQYASFLVNSTDFTTLNTLRDLFALLFVFFLFCVANWSVTTIMDGEGRFKDIVSTLAYSLIPVILIALFGSVLSNLFVIEEMAFYFMLISISIAWFLFLLFTGLLTIHNYTASKTVFTMVLTVFSMLVIVFLISLCMALLQQVYVFVRSVYTEIIYRY